MRGQSRVKLNKENVESFQFKCQRNKAGKRSTEWGVATLFLFWDNRHYVRTREGLPEKVTMKKVPLEAES